MEPESWKGIRATLASGTSCREVMQEKQRPHRWGWRFHILQSSYPSLQHSVNNINSGGRKKDTQSVKPVRGAPSEVRGAKCGLLPWPAPAPRPARVKAPESWHKSHYSYNSRRRGLGLQRRDCTNSSTTNVKMSQSWRAETYHPLILSQPDKSTEAQSFSNFNMYSHHLGIWGQGRFCFRRSGAGPKSLHFNKLPSSAFADGPWTTFRVAKGWKAAVEAPHSGGGCPVPRRTCLFVHKVTEHIKVEIATTARQAVISWWISPSRGTGMVFKHLVSKAWCPEFYLLGGVSS